jgi:HD-like signal output (HDOD) protein
MSTNIKQRILFVDDEPAILAGLQNLLYKDRKRWEMVFANGGEQALAELRKKPCDVVVSDMRMPGMDGATLLNLIKDEFPGTARIMLSGHAEREAIVRALPALHQLLSKPCDAETLRCAIDRGLDHATAAHDEKVRAVIGRVDKLPSPPDVFFELSRIMQAPSASLSDVATIVLKDPSLAAKVLQLVNSAYFGSGQKTSSIAQAVSLLGTDRLRYIGLTASVFSSIDQDPIPEFTLHDQQQKSAEVATLSREFLTGPARDEAFAAALLHDVGHVVLTLGMTEQYREVIASAKERGVPLHVCEREILGVTHAEVGACLLGLWGLPRAIIEVVRHHHAPDLAPPEQRLICAAVHVADAVLETKLAAQIDREAVERAGAGALLPQWLEKAKKVAL